MSVISFETDDLFIIRVIKHMNTNPDNLWANSYEFKALASSTEAALASLAAIVVAFEAAFHYESTIFDRVIVSTWEPDSVPYDPTSFLSSTLSAEGVVAADGDALALNQCLSVTRNAVSGRTGHLFYRNCVAESDVQAPAGKTILNSRTTFQGVLDAALSSSGLNDFIGNPPAEDFGMVMVNADGTQVRPVVALFVQGVTTIKTDHKWFNRTSP